MDATFDPRTLDEAKTLTGNDLDALPFGVIAVDRTGKILEYNTYERAISGMGEREIVGLNFFHDLAPCTAIREFEGRFQALLDSADTAIEPFEFVFPLAIGRQRVNVVFVRTSAQSDRVTICIVRSMMPE
jgi:photoactive yellow protein